MHQKSELGQVFYVAVYDDILEHKVEEPKLLP